MLKHSILLLLLVALTCTAGLLICPKCGYECESDAKYCAHCGAVLHAPASEKMTASEVPDVYEQTPKAPDDHASSSTLPWKDTLENALQQDMQAIKGAIDEEHYVQAWLHAQNAKALSILLNTSPKDLEVLDTRVLKELLNQQFRCPLCHGSGMYIQPVILSYGQPRQQQVPGKACPMCEGRGWVRGHRSEESFIRHRAQAMRNFEERMRRWEREPFAGVWLPKDVRSGLTLRQIVAVRHATGSVCMSCLGLGRFGCSECHGAGRVVCPNDGCIMGKCICPSCNGSRKENSEGSGRGIQRRCQTCMGLGIVDCDVCHGKGWIQCEACEGRGTVLCKACDGTGHKGICKQCDGAGLTVCKRCKGSGTYKGATCETCHGEGYVLCKSCEGSGASRR